MADPLWINASAGLPAYSANELRQAMALVLAYGGRAMGARGGVRPGGTQLQVSLAGSTITVQPGVACVDPALTSPQGPYWVALPVAETPGPLAAADATNPRKDIVILRVYDNDEDSSGLRLARSEYLVGVAAASPTEPAVPAGAIRLATIDVPASPGAPAVTDRRPFVVGSGGILPVRDQAERDALAPYGGLHVWRMDLRRVEVYDSVGWRTIAAQTQVFATVGAPPSGGGTWSKPFGARSVWVRCQGGGGAGGGATTNAAGAASVGGGGGGGAYAEDMIDASTLPASVTVTVGAGGAGGAGAAGGTGGTSSFATYVTAPGGAGGPVRATSASSFAIEGGAGATTGTGTVFCGSAGEGGWGEVALGYSGAGGASHLGGGGRGSRTVNQPSSVSGTAGNRYGGGGGGAVVAGTGAAAAGGAGGQGVVIVTTYF
ncbi:hypothetical protein [Micromonospora inyonensis]|uniref:Glycine-rich domain-containing protein n=1 Tax=Micromonospora inyonensis TaxID=47866 RepID=A0A1C6RDC7_9ACTN|nr:hypothetical protein [Micromonospora inyonensis]SCL15042.1 hypothetical protein GA0074694_1027 [Micromonospora inyonensis]